jgi:lipopolysaccharide O-acetyltransferase
MKRLLRGIAHCGEYTRVDAPDLLAGLDGLRLGSRVTIRGHARIECIRFWGYSGEIHIGSGTSIQLYFHCGAASRVSIGENVLIAGRVYISDHDHAWPEGGEKLIVAPVTIGDNCWLGEGCAILKGVTLGTGCVVGANAVVTRSAPPGSMLVGVPARVVKRYCSQTGTWHRGDIDTSGVTEDERATD